MNTDAHPVNSKPMLENAVKTEIQTKGGRSITEHGPLERAALNLNLKQEDLRICDSTKRLYANFPKGEGYYPILADYTLGDFLRLR